jgi:hypothetical protein
MDHLITADDTEETEIHSKWLDWTWTVRQLFQQPENKKVMKAIKQLRQRISGKFDADTLINELQQMTMEAKTEQFNHWDFSIPEAMIGGAVITLLMLCCCWRLCRQSKDGAYPTLTAPSGPLVINHTVEPARRHDPYH